MTDPIATLKDRLSLPVIVAPMFLISGPDLVIAACRAGLVGAFPTLNARPLDVLEDWMQRITRELAEAEAAQPGRVAPWAANLIVHRSNPRFAEDLDLVVKYRAPIVISALGSPAAVVEAVHSYGGLVLADVNTVEYAKKAVSAGADGLVLVAAGAGGHTGEMTGFSFVPAVRQFFGGPLVLGGGITEGRGVRAAEVLGADLAYMGTRFIAARESLASDAYRDMLIRATIKDIVCSPYFTGVKANYLLPSILAAGIDPAVLTTANPQVNFDNSEKRSKVWKDIWSAGQGVDAITEVRSVAELVEELRTDYHRACQVPPCR